MTQEPNSPSEPTSVEAVSKLLIDRPSDFRFHAAYLIYSTAWDKATSQETKKKLNEIVDALAKNEIDYETFYQEINKYRAEFNPEHFAGGTRTRGYIETQRKSDWRKREERERRNSRYRK